MSIFPTKILVTTDGSEEAALAVKTAAGLLSKTDSELYIVHVRPSITPHYPGYYVGPEIVEEAQEKERDHLEREAQRLLDTQVEQVSAAGGSTAQTHVRVGRPDREIVDLAEEIGAGLIVMGSRGVGGMRRALLGSVSDSVVRHAHCPMMVVRAEPVVFPTKILLATDGSEDANLASSTAADLAKSTNSELHAICVGHVPTILYGSPEAVVFDPELQSTLEEDVEEAAETKLNEQVRKIREAGREITGAHARVGDPDAEIVGLAGRLGAGLIVVGSRGLGPLRRALMGSVSDSVVRHANCPVMVVRRQKERSARDQADLRT